MVLSFLVFAISIIIAITVHEFAHALVADRLGDPTPRAHDRLSLNPLKHLDPLGTLALFIFRFGWGKPVPIDHQNLKEPFRDQMFISLAGPASNLILAILLSFSLRLLPFNPLLFSFFYTLININVVLAVFNLLPFHPLDGSKILLGLVSDDKRQDWIQALAQYSTPILLLLLLPLTGQSLITTLITPPINFILRLLLPL
jgi:Zn-dependent protease